MIDFEKINKLLLDLEDVITNEFDSGANFLIVSPVGNYLNNKKISICKAFDFINSLKDCYVEQGKYTEMADYLKSPYDEDKRNLCCQNNLDNYSLEDLGYSEERLKLYAWFRANYSMYANKPVTIFIGYANYGSIFCKVFKNENECELYCNELKWV